MRYRFVRKRSFVGLTIMGSGRGRWETPNDNTLSRVVADIMFFDLLARVE